MKKKFSRFLSWVLVVAMIAGMLPTSVFAETSTEISSAEFVDDSVDGGSNEEDSEDIVDEEGPQMINTFDDLKGAFAVGGDYVLASDLDITESLTVPADTEIVLDLNGKVLSHKMACTASYQMIENKGHLTIMDSTESTEITGKISFTDTGAGDASFGWGSYTIYNRGTLVVDSGTIENLTALNVKGQPAAHMYCAIQQYSGSTTINGGTISTPTYRSVRINGGTLTVNEGTFVGQVWMQPFVEKTSATVAGGTFNNTWNDASAVFVENKTKEVGLSVTEGTFNGKIGCSNPDALAGAVTGGTFSAAAMEGTSEALLGETVSFKDNGDGTFGVDEQATVEVVCSNGNVHEFETLTQAMNFGCSEGVEKIVVYRDITESMDSLNGNIVSGNPKGVTIKNTIVDAWIYCDGDNFTIGEGVTYDATGHGSGLFIYGTDCVINGTVLTDAYYQRYANTKLTINAPGSMKVKTETFILRYTDGDPNAGIYINGDNNDETIELELAVAYFYQGMISAKDAAIKAGVYWQTNSSDNEGSANLVLDNSKLTVTVNEHNIEAQGTSTVTLKNGSTMNGAGGFVAGAKATVTLENQSAIVLKNVFKKDANTTLNVDSSSSVNDKGGTVALPVAKIGNKQFDSVQAAVDAAADGDEVVLIREVTENVKITQKEGIDLTINGNGNTFNGVMTVFGNGRMDEAETLTIKNVVFQTVAGADACILSPDKTVNNAYSYSHNVTVDNCTFKGMEDNAYTSAAIRHEDGGDKNWTITNCTVDENMHSLLQVNNVLGKLTVSGCTLNSKNGLNFNSTTNVEITGCTANVQGYAVRAGVSSGGNLGEEKVYVMNNNTFKSACADGDAVITLRASAADVNVNMKENVVSGEIHISGTTTATNITADANYWDGKSEPVVSGTAVKVYTHYKDSELTKLGTTNLTGAGTEADPFLINNVDDLLWFQAKVDEQASDGTTQFAGKYFKMTADIDLAGINWNPIGSMSGDHGSFKGVFDGDNHTIYNLKVEQAGDGLGLFARTTGNAEIKNLNLENVTVKSTNNKNYVGGVVGNSYASTKITNVHVTGNIDISGRGYIGGISGHGYVVMDNVSVVGNGTIYSTFWCAGGILGYAGEGATNIMNAYVEGITITSAAGGLGAIVGMAEDNEGTQPISGSNLSAKDVEIKTYIGGTYGDAYANYALGYLIGGNSTSKLEGKLTIENVKVETSTGVAPEINDAVATANGAVYFTLQDAFAAGGEISLIRDVTITNTVTVEAGKEVILNLNGYTITGTPVKAAVYEVIRNKGTLTIAGEGSVVCNHTLAGSTAYAVNTITNTGSLTIDGAVIENKSTAANQIGYAIDNNSTSVDAIVVINSGAVKASGSNYYDGIRLFCNNGTKENSVTVAGGEVSTIWMQNPSDGAVRNTKDQKGSVTITGGTVGALWLEPSTNFSAAVTGGTVGSVGYYEQAEGRDLTGFITGGTFGASSDELAKAFCGKDYLPVKNDDGTYGVKARAYVAQVGNEKYESFVDALKSLKADDTLVLLDNVTITDKWDCRYTGAKILVPVTIDGNGKTLKFTNEINDGYNQYAAFRFEAAVTVKNLTMDMSEALPGFRDGFRAISTKASLTVENCTFIGNPAHKNTRAIIFGEGTGANEIGNLAVSVTNSTFIDWKRGLTDNENGKDVKSVTVTGNAFTNADVYLSAAEEVVFTGNVMDNGWVDVRSYSPQNNLSVVAKDNTLEENAAKVNYIYAKELDAQEGFVAAIPVASVDGKEYKTLKDAMGKADGKTVTLLADTALSETIKVTGTVTLDLNGKVIAGTDNNTKGNFYLFDNRGNFTIEDSVGTGAITLTAVTDRDWGASSVVVANNPGGKLIVNQGRIEHMGGSDMAYAIDNLTNGKGTYAETIINGGLIKSPYRAVRQFLNGVEAQNILTINGGTIEGTNKSVWFQDPSEHANTGTLTIGEHAALKGDVYLSVTKGSTEWPVVVSISAAALKDGSEVLGLNVPDDKVIVNVNGVYGVAEAVVQVTDAADTVTKYASLKDALAAANASADAVTITLLENIELSESVAVAGTVILDLNGKTITGTDNKESGNFYLIDVKRGDLTIQDSVGGGKITLTATKERNWTASSVVVANQQGTLNVTGGTIQHLGGTSMAYGIDNLTNGGIGDAATTITGGAVDSSYFAIRQFANSSTKQNTVVITGGEIGYVWMQSPNSAVNTAATTVTGGSVAGVCVSGVNADYALSVKADCVETVYGTMPTGMTLTNVNGVYSLAKAVALVKDKTGNETAYATLREAVDAASAGATITLLDDVILTGGYEDAEEALRIEKGITIEGDGHTIDCGSFRKGIRVYRFTGSNMACKFNNVEIVNNMPSGRCIDVRSSKISLTVTNSTLTAEGTNSQPLTLGGEHPFYKTTVSATKINAGASGYGIITFNDMDSNGGLTISNGSKVTGYAALYVKGDNAKISLSNASLIGNNSYNGADNNFGTVVFEGNNNVMNMTFKASSVTANAQGESTQAAFLFTGTGNTVKLTTLPKVYADGNRAVLVAGSVEGLETATVIDNGYGSFAAAGYKVVADAAGNNYVTVKPIAAVHGLAYTSFSDAMNRVGKEAATITLVAKDVKINHLMVGHQFVQNITIDLNGGKLYSTDKTLTAYRKGTVLTIVNGTVSGNSTGGTLVASYGGTLVLGKDAVVTCGGQANAIKVAAGELVVEENAVVTAGAKNWLVVDNAAANKVTISNGSFTGKMSIGADAVCEISGGLFTTEIAPEWCAEFYAPVDLGEAAGALRYTVEDTREAMIGDVKYLTLADAIEAAKDGDTIVVTKDIAVDKEDQTTLDGQYATFFTVADKAITIDLNGKKVYADAAGIEKMIVGLFSMEDTGKMTLKDSKGGAVVQLDSNGANVYSMLAAYNPTTELVVEGGSYILDNASDDLIYTAGNGNVTIKDGNFQLGNVGTGENQSPWMFNALGKNTNHVNVLGGTFNTDVNHQYWAHEVYVPNNKAVKANGDGTWTVVDAVAYVKEIASGYSREVGYATLAEAVAAADSAEEVITLLADTTGAGVVIDKAVTIDFNGNTYSVNSGVGSTGTQSNGFQILSGNDVTLKNGTLNVAAEAADKFYILVQNYANLTVENMTLDGTNLDKYAFVDGYSYTLSNNSGNVNIIGSTTILANSDGKNAFAFDACKYASYEAPVVTVANGVVVEGKIEYVSKVEATGYTVYYAEEIGEAAVETADGVVLYNSLAQAVEAAKDGETVIVLADVKVNKDDITTLDDKYHTFFKVTGKSITVNLNGKKITGNPTGLDDMLVGIFSTEKNGHLTLTDAGNKAVVEVLAKGTGAEVYGLIVNYDKTSTITVNGGNYHLDEAIDALVYSGGPNIVTINGGNFRLDNVGEGPRGNGSPWIFNVLGQDEGPIVVTGGSFNADVSHQFWFKEAEVVKEKALQHKDGIWTVVNSVVYVNEYRLGGPRPHFKAVGYATLEEAIASALSDETIVLYKDVTLAAPVTVSADKDIKLDLNGFVLSYASADRGVALLTNRGELIITDNSEAKAGKISYCYTGAPDSAYSKMNAAVFNYGKLTIENGTVENTTEAMSHASYAINTDAGAALTINGGKVLNLNAHAIRQVSFGTAANNVVVNGGYIEGTRGIQFQLPGSASAKAPEMNLTINGGTIVSNEDTYNLAVYVYSNGQSAEKVKVTITGGTFNGNVALNGAATGTMAEAAVSVSGGTFSGESDVFSYAEDEELAQKVISITGGSLFTE